MVRNVFLSFTTEDELSANLFRDQAKARQPSLVLRDYSVKDVFERTWRQNAERLIGACEATICLVSKKTHRSEAVNWEIRKSVEMGKRVMGVVVEPMVSKVPTALVELDVELLQWDVEKILGELHDMRLRHS